MAWSEYFVQESFTYAFVHWDGDQSTVRNAITSPFYFKSGVDGHLTTHGDVAASTAYYDLAFSSEVMIESTLVSQSNTYSDDMRIYAKNKNGDIVFDQTVNDLITVNEFTV
jgi:hypothetical protein